MKRGVAGRRKSKEEKVGEDCKKIDDNGRQKKGQSRSFQ